MFHNNLPLNSEFKIISSLFFIIKFDFFDKKLKLSTLKFLSVTILNLPFKKPEIVSVSNFNFSCNKLFKNNLGSIFSMLKLNLLKLSKKLAFTEKFNLLFLLQFMLSERALFKYCETKTFSQLIFKILCLSASLRSEIKKLIFPITILFCNNFFNECCSSKPF